MMLHDDSISRVRALLRRVVDPSDTQYDVLSSGDVRALAELLDWVKADFAVVYHLPEVNKAIAAGETICIAGDEKNCDALMALGFTATTVCFGMGEWSARSASYLRGAHDIVIFCDNRALDGACAERIAQSLRDIGILSIKIIPLSALQG